MKKLLLTAVLFAVSFTTFAQVGIGTTNPKGALDVVSTTQGFLPPRMTEAQMNAISGTNLSEGLVVYCTDCNTIGCLNVYTNGSWDCVITAATTGPVVSNDCTANGFEGTYTDGAALSGASFSVTVKNDSFNTVDLAFAAGDIVLRGSGRGTVSVDSTVNPATANLIAGDSQLVTYTLIGTPDLGGLEAVWTKLSLNCTKTQVVDNGDATFTLPQTEYFVSRDDGTSIGIQGVITNGDTFTIPYTSGLGNYDTYNTPKQSLAQELTIGGTRDMWLSWGGTFSSSGDIIVTINVTGDTNTYSVPAQLGGATSVFGTFDLNINGNNKGSINLKAIGACAVDDGAGGSYLFLCHNLGADTSLEPHTPVVGLQGGYIKWGLQGPPNWVGADNNGSLGFAAAPTASDPNTDVAISGWGISIVQNGAWNNGTEDDPVKDTNNDPCPVGFRVPTRTEWKGVIENNTESTTGTFNSDDSMYGSAYHYGPNGTTKLLTLPAAGRHAKSGYSYNRGETCYYWSSSESENSNDDSYYYRGNNVVNSGYRGEAFSVRCIAE